MKTEVPERSGIGAETPFAIGLKTVLVLSNQATKAPRNERRGIEWSVGYNEREGNEARPHNRACDPITRLTGPVAFALDHYICWS